MEHNKKNVRDIVYFNNVEKGYNAIPGIMAKPINSHSDFRKTLVELRDPEVQEKF